MDKKVLFSLFMMTFSLSVFLSIAGLIPTIAHYYHVSITMAGLFLSLFALILAITSLILPSYLSIIERKKFFTITLLIFIISSFLQIFITNFYIGLIIRLIPAFFYSSAISIALTVIGELSCKETNKVILGVPAGSVLGLSISTEIGIVFGYPSVNVWMCLINIVSLICILLFFPKLEGHKRNYFASLEHAKSEKFIISVLFILFIGIAISIVFNYFAYFLLEITCITTDMSLYLLSNGVASVIGTYLFGYLINKKKNVAILIYPIIFLLVIFSFYDSIEIPILVFILLIIFGLLDGSMHIIAQFWISSSIRKAPEFGNGVYLFTNNLNRALGIFIGGMMIDIGHPNAIFIISMALFLIAPIFVYYRMKKYPNLI